MRRRIDGVNLLRVNSREAAYIKEVLDCFAVKVPDATAKYRKDFAARILFRLRLWDLIYRFSMENYRTTDVLNAEYIE